MRNYAKILRLMSENGRINKPYTNLNKTRLKPFKNLAQNLTKIKGIKKTPLISH